MSNINNVETHTSINEPFTEMPQTLIEGLTNTAYCQPIDVIDSEGAEEANLTIPLDGIYSPNDATNNMIRTSVNFMSFVLVLLFTYMLTPIVYNEYIIGLITELHGQDKMLRIRSIDIYICIVFITATVSLITSGVNTNNPNSTVFGFLLGLFFVISFFIIQTKKMNPEWFKEMFSLPKSSTITANYQNITFPSMGSDFAGFFSENFWLYISNWMIGGILIGIIIVLAVLSNSFRDKGILNSGDGVIYLFLLSVYVTIAVSTIRSKNNT